MLLGNGEDMTRKRYIMPEIEEIEIAVCEMLASSMNIDSESKGDYEEDFAGRRRGTWGNLWDEKN